jgi:SNF2 family DNA or RNA helicase
VSTFFRCCFGSFTNRTTRFFKFLFLSLVFDDEFFVFCFHHIAFSGTKLKRRQEILNAALLRCKKDGQENQYPNTSQQRASTNYQGIGSSTTSEQQPAQTSPHHSAPTSVLVATANKTKIVEIAAPGPIPVPSAKQNSKAKLKETMQLLESLSLSDPTALSAAATSASSPTANAGPSTSNNSEIKSTILSTQDILDSCKRLLKSPLMSHQVQGLLWMYERETVASENQMLAKVRGGCLADEMGLGKTLQILALIAVTRAAEGKSCGPTLIVCPLVLMQQWEQEASKHLEKKLKVVRYRCGLELCFQQTPSLIWLLSLFNVCSVKRRTSNLELYIVSCQSINFPIWIQISW